MINYTKNSLLKLTLCLLLLAGMNTTFAQTWNQLGMDMDGETPNNQSGAALSLSADGLTLAIGATGNYGSGSKAGHVRVYSLDTATWTQIGADIDGEAAFDHSGVSVSLSADSMTVAIGATGNNGNGAYSGHVRVYSFISGAWTQIGADIDGEAADDLSGRSVSLSADGLTVAIGAPENDGNGSNAGHVRVYSLISGVWTQQGADIDGEATDDESGWSVSLSADSLTVAIGAPNNDGNGQNAGHVRVFKLDTGAWIQQGADIDGEAIGDLSGQSVSLSADGLTVAVGARYNDENGTDAGHVRVYELISGVWTQKGSDIDGEAADDRSGGSISLSADGLTLAIGAQLNDGNGSNAGHVRIYKFTTGEWTQLGPDIEGEAMNDESGLSVNLSADSLTVAVGARFNDGNGNDAGHVRAYKFCPVDVSITNNAPTLTANTFGATYQWLDCDNNFDSIVGETSRSFIPRKNGNYAVAVSYNGCTGISYCEAVHNAGLAENSFGNNFKLYPNPTDGNLHIEFGKTYKYTSITVTNQVGQEVLKKELDHAHSVDLNLDVMPGIYFLEILSSKGHRALLKAIKQ